MKKHFRLYTDNQAEYNSTIFDLINGDKETKQTKGLAYILSHYTDFLFSFLNFPPLAETITNKINTLPNINNISAIEVSAERITVNKTRADIVIKIDKNKKPLIAIVIEAKSIKVNVNQQALSSQIEGYLEDNQFKDLLHYPKIGVALTKYNQNIPNIANISWENVIQILLKYCKNRQTNEVITQY